VPVTVEDLFRLRTPDDIQLSPDGKQVAFTVAEWVPDQARQRTRIWLVSADGGEPRPLTGGPRQDNCPRWSPDSHTLAFVSDCAGEGDDRKPQLYVVDASGGEPRQICQMPNGMGELAWAPDGSRITFISDEGPEPGKDPIVVGAERHRRLWTVRPTSDTPEPVTAPNLTVWLYAWAPGSDRFAVYFSDEPGETAWYRGQLGIVPSAGGAVRQLGRLARQAAALAWSPDGRQLIYVSGEWSDRPLVGGDLWVLRVDTAEARNLTPGTPISVGWAAWLPSGEQLLVVGWDRVWHSIGVVPTLGGAIRPLASQVVLAEWDWPRLSATPDGRRFAVARTDLTTPPDVWLGELRTGRAGAAAARTPRDIAWRRLTRLNPVAEETLAQCPTEVVTYAGADGWPIAALLTMPFEQKRGAPPPLIVQVHGGPSAANRAAWMGPSTIQQWATAGFAVLQPNFRGSLGRGVAFADAIVGDMGGKDLEDVLRGIDYLAAAGRVDGDRVGIAGWSYGGFASAWSITQTARFKAALVGAGVTDYHSFHAQSNIPDWDRRFLAADPYEQPEAYRARSPITYVGRVGTPTLIAHGERDECVPVNQAYAFHRALRERGVPTELVIYPREGHGVREREHLRDLSARTLRWWETYL
jgi:dipeptidyl aminopeptidase/acylaminoacyl peptidase